MSAVPLLKCLSMADVCLTSLPTIVASKQYTKNPPRILSSSLRLTPYKTQLSSPFLAFKRERKTSVVLLVARTSDWAQQEEKEGEFVWGGEDKEGGKGGVGQEWEEDGESGEFEGGVVTAQAGGGEEGGAFEESYPEPSEEAKIFVGNLPFDMDSEKLANLFDKAGIVEVAEVIYNRETDQSRGFGFVTMSTVNEVEKAVEMFNRYEVSGRFLTVNKASPKGQRFERPERGERSDRPPREFGASFRLYVGNLPWQVDDSRLQQLFSEHGKVVEARVVYDRETGRSRGFGFVTMSSKNEIDDAISALDGQSLDGRQLRVNVAEEKPRRSFY